MNFITLKIILKINKKKIMTDPGLIFIQGTLLVAYYIYARYEKNPGGTSLVMALANRRTDRSA